MQDLCQIIGYQFKDISLLEMALTHSSYTNENHMNPLSSYERLEFLGDSVLQIISSDFLYKGYTHLPEGKLSKARASLVCETALHKSALEMGLGKYLKLSKGEEHCGGRERVSILADVVEAIIGAIYLDDGLDEAASFIYRFVLKDADSNMRFKDYKTLLQEYAQKYAALLSYELISAEGPDHDKTFKTRVLYNGEEVGSGIGKSKKAAEQNAAESALRKFNQIK